MTATDEGPAADETTGDSRADDAAIRPADDTARDAADAGGDAEVTAPLIRAAGGVLWRPADRPSDGRDGPDGSGNPGGGADTNDGAGGPTEIAVIHRPKYDDWSLPKGKLDRGEQPLQAACREVVEETGVQPVVQVRLPSVSYRVRAADGGLAPKVVDYWAMRAAEGAFSATSEVDALEWLDPDTARKRLTQAHDISVVTAFAEIPPVTAIVLLVRHAKAGSRKAWSGEDRDRPLDASGLRQTDALTMVLPWFRPDRVLSVDKARCTQTVRPLADALGLTVEPAARFSEEHHEGAPGDAAEAIRELADSGGVTVVCSQGGVIPDTVAALAAEAGVGLERSSSPKGSVWVLAFSGPTLCAADLIPAASQD